MLLFPPGCISLPSYYFGDPFLVIRVCISLGPDPFCANQTKNVTSCMCFGGYHSLFHDVYPETSSVFVIAIQFAFAIASG